MPPAPHPGGVRRLSAAADARSPKRSWNMIGAGTNRVLISDFNGEF